MRRGLLMVACVALLSSFFPAAQAATAPQPTLDPVLIGQLANAKQTDRLAVFVHSKDIVLARSAVKAGGLKLIDSFRRVGIAVAIGTPAQIAKLKSDSRVVHLEGNRKLSYMLDTSHKATRGEELYEGFDATTTEQSDPVCTGKSRKRRRCTTPPPTTVTHHVQSDGSGTSIAIVDSGVDGTHPMFQMDGASKVVVNKKLVCHDIVCADELGLGLGSATDPLWIDATATGNDTDTPSAGGHGTHVAGIAAGVPVTTSDGRRLHGAAPGAKIVALSVGASLSVYAGAAGMNWVLEHHNAPCGPDVSASVCPPIKVVNNSWGVTGGTEYDPHGVDEVVSDALARDGVVVAWANGNDGGNGTSNLSNGFGDTPVPGVITVANYDNADSPTTEGWLDPSSSRGAAGHPETYPDISAPGTEITSACRPTLTICGTGFDTRDPNYNTISGTSMATPHIAGIVAQLASLNPSLTPGDIETILEDTAHKFLGGGPYEYDPAHPENSSSFDKGHGLVDVVQAARVALRYDSAPAGKFACTDANGPVMVDRTGDATATPAPSDARFDITDGRFTVNPDDTATFTVTVPGLSASDLPDTQGLEFDSAITYDGVQLDLVAARLLNDTGLFNEIFTVTNNTTTPAVSVDVPGSFDPGHGVVMTLPRSALETLGVTDPFAAGTVVSGFSTKAWRTEGALNIAADIASQYCPYTVGVGAIPPPPAPEPPSPPPPPTSSGTTFFLHHTGGCSGADGEREFMDLTNSTGDDDGCGQFGLAVGAPDISVGGEVINSHETDVFPSDVPLGTDVPAGSTVSGKLFIASYNPAPLEAEVSLRRGTEVLADDFSSAVLSTGIGEQLIGNNYVEIDFTLTVDTPLSAADVLTLGVSIDTTVTWFWGYEGDHASQFTIDPAGSSA